MGRAGDAGLRLHAAQQRRHVALDALHRLRRVAFEAQQPEAVGPVDAQSVDGAHLLHRESGGARSLAFFALAMALHFVVNDFGLLEHHKRRYRAVGRWVISVAVLAGFAIGLFTTVHRAMIAVLVAFLAGGVILNVMKEELPRERESRFSAFQAGAAAYSVLLLAL